MKQDIYNGLIVLLKALGMNRCSEQCHREVKNRNVISVDLGIQILHQHGQYQNDFMYEKPERLLITEC